MTNVSATEALSKPKASIPPHWHTTDKFTGDEVIDAFYLGKETGIQIGWNENIKILVKQMMKNIEEAVKISEDLYKEVLANGISLKTIHLRSDGISKFTSLFVADINDYTSDNFLKVHSIARNYRGNNKSQDVYLSFLFMPLSENISKDCLSSDGYFLTYDKTK
jgi:hypothetical protein